MQDLFNACLFLIPRMSSLKSEDESKAFWQLDILFLEKVQMPLIEIFDVFYDLDDWESTPENWQANTLIFLVTYSSALSW